MTDKSNYDQALDILEKQILEPDGFTTEMYLQEAQVRALLAIADSLR